MSYQGAVRECLVCRRTASSPQRKIGEPIIMAICLEISRRGSGKNRLIRARRVNVCDHCFTKAVGRTDAGYTAEASLVFDSIRASLQESYSTVLREEEQFSREPLCR
jgi:hypothetical protein